jgi:hypothetical protein
MLPTTPQIIIEIVTGTPWKMKIMNTTSIRMPMSMGDIKTKLLSTRVIGKKALV